MSWGESEIRNAGEGLALRFMLADDTVIADLLSLPKEIALAVLAHMVQRTTGYQHRTTDLLRIKLTREAVRVGGYEVSNEH